MSAQDAPGGGAGRPSEEELRAAYEAELARITSVDMIAQSVVSLLSIGARRLGLPGASAEQGGERAGSERDLDQVRDAIDAVRGLLDVLERRVGQQELRSLRDALSQLQLAYARAVQAGAGQEAPPAAAQPEGEQGPGTEAAAQKDEREKGPAESSGKLWVPGR